MFTVGYIQHIQYIVHTSIHTYDVGMYSVECRDAMAKVGLEFGASKDDEPGLWQGLQAWKRTQFKMVVLLFFCLITCSVHRLDLKAFGQQKTTCQFFYVGISFRRDRQSAQSAGRKNVRRRQP